MSWLFSQALVEVFSEDTSLDGEQSAPLSGSNTQQAYCAPDKMTGFSKLSRYGMTYKPLTESRGEELLMLYREGFHAKISAQQEKAQALTESAAECGEKWHGSFTKYSPDTSSWKTHQCSLLGDLDEFSETWPQWGLMRDGQCWEQRTLEQTIRGTGYGLSPDNVSAFHTPNTTGLDGGSNSRKALRARMEMWRTPTAHEWKNTGHSTQIHLSDQVRPEQVKNAKKMAAMWPTPKVQDSRHAKMRHLDESDDHWKSNLGEVVSAQVNGGSLNPTWVEWLMGWPLGWTDLKPLVMDKSHCVRPPLGES
jgi:hypothetical protein